MSSSDRRAPRSAPGLSPLVAPPPKTTAADVPRAPSSYTRFIPREEIGSVAAWTPGSFGDRRSGPTDRRTGAGASVPPAPDDAERAKLQAQAVDAARQAGYRDGYRDGLVALESFKRSYAQQVSAQIGDVVGACQTQLDALQHAIAAGVTDAVLALARQVVRQELHTQPALVARVAAEAVDALLDSARGLVLRLHPDDIALVAEGAAETLAARGARLVPDAAVDRGGCIVDSDIGRVDARVAERWQRAVARLGRSDAWLDSTPAPLETSSASSAASTAACDLDTPPAAPGAFAPESGR